MKKVLDILSNVLAVLWFFGVLLGTVVFMLLSILVLFFVNIVGVLRSGFATSCIGFAMLFLFSLIFAVTGSVPAFRKCYYKLPWLYPLCMILTMHLTILSLAEYILSVGFSVMDQQRHMISILVMIAVVVICRIIMCIYLKKRPLILQQNDIGWGGKK